MMRLILLFAFIFIVILQITCNGNECGRQSNLIDCAEIQGQATFIHVRRGETISARHSIVHLVLGNIDWPSDVSTGDYRHRGHADRSFNCGSSEKVGVSIDRSQKGKCSCAHLYLTSSRLLPTNASQGPVSLEHKRFVSF